jgi:hypothetical protein
MLSCQVQMPLAANSKVAMDSQELADAADGYEFGYSTGLPSVAFFLKIRYVAPSVLRTSQTFGIEV